MRHHKLALCKTHYLAWLPPQVERFIQKYGMFQRGQRILVAVSGGKDSLSLWDILWRLGYGDTTAHGGVVDGLYIGLGIDEGAAYSAESQRLSQAFADQRGLRLRVVDVAERYGESIPQMAGRTFRGKQKPCSVCGVSKRHIMNRSALEGGYDVLATGHNLDDEAATLFGNTMNWQTGYLARQSPVLEANRPGLVRKVKPLCRFYEREMAAYALLSEIEYIYEECPFARGAKSIYYKELLNRMEAQQPGAKMNFYLGFLQARQAGAFSSPAPDEPDRLHACETCGQPTSAPGSCAFCRMVTR